MRHAISNLRSCYLPECFAMAILKWRRKYLSVCIMQNLDVTTNTAVLTNANIKTFIVHPVSLPTDIKRSSRQRVGSAYIFKTHA